MEKTSDLDEHFKANKPSLAIRPVFGISGCSSFNVLAITSKMCQQFLHSVLLFPLFPSWTFWQLRGRVNTK